MGLGLVVLEAMMAGVPLSERIVAYQLGHRASKNWSHRTEDDVNALHDAVAELLNTALRTELAENAHAEIERTYTMESLTTTMKQWYGVI